MLFLVFLTLIIAGLLSIIFLTRVQVYAEFDSTIMSAQISLRWLSFISGFIVIKKGILYITVRLFNKVITTQEILIDSNNARGKLIKAISFDAVKVNIYYALKSPFLMGILSSVISALASTMHVGELNQSFDILSSDEYFRVFTNINVNLGKTFKNLIMKGEKTWI